MQANSEIFPDERSSLSGQEFDAAQGTSLRSMLNDTPSLFVGWAYQRLHTPSRLHVVVVEQQRELSLPYFDTPEGSTPHTSWKPRGPGERQ